MRVILKIGFILVVTLGYAAWALWCYNKFGADMTPVCLGSWAFMVLCKLVVGFFVVSFYEGLFTETITVSGLRMKNPPKPPPKYTKVNYKAGKTAY